MDDRDFDLDDIKGNVSQEGEPVIEVVAEVPEELQEEKSEWELCVERLEKNLDKPGIAVPVFEMVDQYTKDTGQIRAARAATKWIMADVETCSPELFFEWLLYIWPHSKKFKHKPENYAKIEDRLKAWYHVTNMLGSLLKFPEVDITGKKK